MYNLPKSQVSFRLKGNEYELLNSISQEIQEKIKRDFANPKDFIFELVKEREDMIDKIDLFETEAKNLTSQLESLEKSSEDDNQLHELFKKAKELIGYEEKDPTDVDIMNDLLEIINTPMEPAPVVEKIVEKEVERKLKANELLLELSEKQSKFLELIARWRYSKKLDEKLKTPEEVIKSMIFNKPSLLNYGGGFKTGIKPKTIR